MKKIVISAGVFLLSITVVLVYFFVIRKEVTGKILIPYVSHQKPRIDPHLPSSVPISDKLDEVLFDGLFNIQATPSGVLYEDGLGELIGIDKNFVVSVRLKPQKKWHSSYAVSMNKKKISTIEKQAFITTVQDLKFTLQRIQKLGSLSPDYILISQAMKAFDFSGPDENNVIHFQFRSDSREWVDADIKEVLSFKILPANSSFSALQYTNGTGPYLYAGEFEDAIFFYKNPASIAQIPEILLKPYIDNSTYTTEMKNHSVNTLLNTPFGSLSPILTDTSDFFYKSSISTSFFAIFYNVQRLKVQQRIELRKLINNQLILDRFYKVNTPQQKHITDYKGNINNYSDYLNYSIFPSSSYYIEEKIISPLKQLAEPDLSILPDTVHIQACVNYDFKEEITELATILNDPSLFHGRVKVTAVQNEELRNGNYDAVLVAISGYRSNFLFDLYEIFLREPDLANHAIHLQTGFDNTGQILALPNSFEGSKNFFRLDLGITSKESENYKKLLEYIFGFMSTHEIGDKLTYAKLVDELDQQMAFGSWLFSLPSLAYFSTQFNAASIDLYGIASQLSTIEKWRERQK